MNKKTFIQFLLFVFLLLIIFFIYQNYKLKNNSKLINLNPKTEILSKNNNQNIIREIKYMSKNNNGVKFQLEADFGEINFDNPDIIYLHNVEGVVMLENGEEITINSEFANFNSKSFETTFINRVKIIRQDQTITGEELYFVLDASEEELNKNPNKDQNLIRIKKDVIFKKPGYILKSDVVEIDLITKNSKIFMNNKKNKVIVDKYEIR